MDALMKNLTLNPNIVLYRSINDAIINFDKICRICLQSEDIKCIFDVVYENIHLSDILNQHISIKVLKDDALPKHICDSCIVDLIKFYNFKRKCKLSEETLNNIIKYNETRKVINEKIVNDNQIDIPFVLQHIVENEVEETTTETNESKCEDSIDDNSNLEDSINLSDYENDINKTITFKENVRPLPTFTCKQCDISYNSRKELMEHKKNQKHEKSRSPRRKCLCPICAKLCYSGYFKSHMRMHTNEKPFKCDLCLKTFTLGYNLKRHMMTHTGERPHTCEFCGKGFIQIQSLREHVKQHTKQDENTKSLECKYCGRCFKRQGMYKYHVQRHMNMDLTTKKTVEVNDNQIYTCKICERTFETKHRLRLHKIIHKEKKFLCNDCGKTFCRNASLQQHQKVHTGERPYRCQVCQKTFAYSCSFDKHVMIHMGLKPYKCKICEKSFTQVPHLKYHLRTHSGEKPYLCTYCGKRFALNGNLTVHIRTHTGETPYICNICGRGFYDSSSMRRHHRGHSKVEISATTIKAVESILLKGREDGI